MARPDLLGYAVGRWRVHSQVTVDATGRLYPIATFGKLAIWDVIDQIVVITTMIGGMCFEPQRWDSAAVTSWNPDGDYG